MTRLYGRSQAGERCVDRTPHGHWQSMTMLSAITCERVLEPATVVFDGSINGPTFLFYVQRCLVPALQPGQTVVMDNLAAHKVAGVREAIEAADCDLCYLPPYSPDFNPIEELWSKVKTSLRRDAATTFATVTDASGDALRAVALDECRNYFV